MGFGMKTHDQSVNIPITSSHPALQYPRVLFAQVFKAFPWPLGALGYQVREGRTAPLIPCSCVHIIVAWELGRNCRLDGRESVELNLLVLCLLTP